LTSSRSRQGKQNAYREKVYSPVRVTYQAADAETFHSNASVAESFPHHLLYQHST